MKTFSKTSIAVAAAGVWLAPAPPVAAQEVAEAGEAVVLEEIVVTSTRRSTGIQQTPINITAVGGEMIDSMGLDELDDLASQIPGLSLIESGPWGNSTIIVRGLNADSLTGTGNNTNGGGTVGVYLGETPLYADFKLLDLERVEALMGPQGTLYGAGTLGGAIRYIPNRPDLVTQSADFHAQIYDVAHGDGVGHQEDITVNVPLIEGKLAVRAVAGWYADPGFIDYTRIVRVPGFSNPQPDPNDPDEVAAHLTPKSDLNYEDTFSSRVSALWAPTGRFEALLTLMHQDTGTGGRQFQSADASRTGPYEASPRFAEPSDRKADLGALELDFDTGFADLVSSTSYSSQKIETFRDQTDLLLYLSDTGGYGYEDFPQFVAWTEGDTQRDQLTQELRLVSHSEGPLNWIVGGFYNDLQSDGVGVEYTPGLPEFFGVYRPDDLEYYNRVEIGLKEQAAYAEIGYPFTDAWQVTVGGRYYEYDQTFKSTQDLPLLNTLISGDPYEFSPNIKQGGTGANGSLFKLNTSYQFTADLMGYATVSQGYRLGGFNSVAPCPDSLEDGQQYVCALPNEQQYEPDETLNKEVGVRTQWFDHRLTVNASLFHINWDKVQVGGTTVNGGVGITVNGAEAVSQGFETSLRALLGAGFSLYGNYAYTQAELTKDTVELLNDRFGSVDVLKGDRLPGSPEHSGSLNLDYDTYTGGGYLLGASYGVRAQSDVLTKVGGRASGEALGGYATSHLRLTAGKDNWQVALFGDNIFDQYAFTAVTNDRSYLDYTVAGDGTSFDVRRYNRTVIRPAVFGVDFRLNFGL